VLPITIEERLRKIWHFKVCAEVFLILCMVFDGISESGRKSYVNLLRKGAFGLQVVVTINGIFCLAFPSLNGAETRFMESIVRGFRSKSAMMPATEPLPEAGKTRKATKLSKKLPYKSYVPYYKRRR